MISLADNNQTNGIDIYGKNDLKRMFANFSVFRKKNPNSTVLAKYESVDDYSSNRILIHFIRLYLLTFRFEVSFRKRKS